jgi:hypothetical protein
MPCCLLLPALLRMSYQHVGGLGFKLTHCHWQWHCMPLAASLRRFAVAVRTIDFRFVHFLLHHRLQTFIDFQVVTTR